MMNTMKWANSYFMGETDKSYSSKATEREKSRSCKSEQKVYFFEWCTHTILQH